MEGYENLLDYFTEQASRRHGETKGALLSLKRGVRRLDSNEPYQAIKQIGKSLPDLYKKETKKDLYTALNLLSECYKKVDLLWASRANLLLAASIVTDEFWKSGDLIATQAYMYNRLAIVELRLGRVNYALSWWHLAMIVDSQLEGTILTENELSGLDAYLSQCILNSDIETLKWFEKLPDLLDDYQLYSSRSMLLYALGHDDLVKEEYKLTIDQEFQDYLKIVRDTDFGANVPLLINCEERYSTIQTNVMGTCIVVSFPFRSPLVELAETILSVIEGFFSTSLVDGIWVVEPRLEIEITADDGESICISHEIDDSSVILKFDVLCSSFTTDALNISGQSSIQAWLQEFIIDVFARLITHSKLENALDSIFLEDRALERSVPFGSNFVGLQNIMGDDAVREIRGLFNNREFKTYNLNRSVSWDHDHPKTIPPKKKMEDLRVSDKESANETIDIEKITHRNVRLQRLIKVRLWDRAVWHGVGYAQYPIGAIELAILFENKEAGTQLFKDLNNEIGDEDKENRLRVSIVRNFSKKNPAHYRVCISENVDVNSSKLVNVIARVNTMTPMSCENLDRFLGEFEKSKSYYLHFGLVKDGAILPVSQANTNPIRKFDINVVEAWQIGPNDLELMALQSEDDPYVPDGIKNPPYKDAQKRKLRSP